MKKMLFPALCLIFFIQSIAQTTGKLIGLRDNYGTTYNYVGEIKNKMPNGLGIAIYSNDYTLWYSGYFVDGVYNGKGVLLFKDSSFLSGDWKDGKLNGKGTNLTSGGDLYIGLFLDGKKDGKGSYIFANDGLVTGHFKNDKYDGRCIYVPPGGTLIADNIYVADKKNGSGYIYDVASKTLTEGTFTDGELTASGTASYMSFLKSDNFYGEKTDDQVIMGIIDRNDNNLLKDTGFYYNLKNNSRDFGYHEKGFLSDGILIKDSTRFIGKISDNGAYDYCSFYKKKKFYDEGNYKNDFLNGSGALSIDLTKLTVYYGDAANNGQFVGKGWYTNRFNEIYSGQFDSSQFTGSGYIVFANGKTIHGTFKNGIPQNITAFTDENGIPIPQHPKTFSDALSIVTNEYSNDYQAFKLDFANAEEYSVDDYLDTYESLISFPGATEKDVILEDYDFSLTYNIRLYTGINYQQAASKYNELCTTLSATSLNLKYSTAPVSLSGITTEPAESATTRSKFSLSNYSSLSQFNIYAELKYDDGIYEVNIIVGDISFDK